MLSRFSTPYSARRCGNLDRLRYGLTGITARLCLSVEICWPGRMLKGSCH